MATVIFGTDRENCSKLVSVLSDRLYISLMDKRWFEYSGYARGWHGRTDVYCGDELLGVCTEIVFIMKTPGIYELHGGPESGRPGRGRMFKLREPA